MKTEILPAGVRSLRGDVRSGEQIRVESGAMVGIADIGVETGATGGC
jgi:hypothetical protein